MTMTVAIEAITRYIFICDECGEQNELGEDERTAVFARCPFCDSGFNLEGSADNSDSML